MVVVPFSTTYDCTRPAQERAGSSARARLGAADERGAVAWACGGARRGRGCLCLRRRAALGLHTQRTPGALILCCRRRRGRPAGEPHRANGGWQPGAGGTGARSTMSSARRAPWRSTNISSQACVCTARIMHDGRLMACSGREEWRVRRGVRGSVCRAFRSGGLPGWPRRLDWVTPVPRAALGAGAAAAGAAGRGARRSGDRRRGAGPHLCGHARAGRLLGVRDPSGSVTERRGIEGGCAAGAVGEGRRNVTESGGSIAMNHARRAIASRRFDAAPEVGVRQSGARRPRPRSPWHLFG